jgi:adhesin transport system outer membrane protein
MPEDGEYPSVVPVTKVKVQRSTAPIAQKLLLPDYGEYPSVIPATRVKVAKKKPAPAPALAALSAEDSATLSPAAGSPAPQNAPAPAAGELPLEDAIDRALSNSPERLIAMAQEGQAKASLKEARAPYYPQGVYNLSAGREFNDPLANSEGALASSGYNWASSQSVNIRQMIYDGFITRETVAQRLAALESTSHSKSKVSEELIKSTVEAYMQVYQFQHIVQASRENLEALRDILKLVGLRLKGGDASRAELQYMQARVAAAEQSYVTSQASLRDAINALAFIIGDVPDFAAQKPPLDPYLIPNTADVLEKSLDNNNEIKIARAELKATRHELYAAQGRYMPEVTLVADGAHSDQLGGRTGSRDFGSLKVQMSYRFLDGGQREAGELKAHQKLNELKSRKERIVREITQKVRNDLNKQQTALKELKIAENEIVANTELEALYRKQFKSGDIDITNLVESQERIYSARLKKYSLEGDLVNVAFSILKDTSDLLPRLCKGQRAC